MSEIHVFERDDGVEVWLDTEIAEEDGLCIGSAATKAEALTEAIDDLEGAVGSLTVMRDVARGVPAHRAGEGEPCARCGARLVDCECRPVEHVLKTLPDYFQAVRSGAKRFEVRRDDRDFQSGDTVRLREHDDPSGYSGRELSFRIGYMLRDFLPGYVIFALEALATDPITAAVDAQLDPLKDDLIDIGHKLAKEDDRER